MDHDGWLSPSHRRRAAVSRAVLLAACAVYAVSTVPGVRAPGYSLLFDGVLSTAIIAASALLIGTRAALVRNGRIAWAAMAVAVAVYAFGDVAYSGWVQFADPIPYPSLADVAWLAFYPFAYVSLVLLVRRRVALFHRSMWLDGVVGMVGVAGIGSIVVHRVVAATGGSHAEVATTVAYPLADLLLLVIVIGSYGLFHWRPGRAWYLLGAGLAVYAAADLLYALRVANGTYDPGTMLDALWPLGYALTACAALTRPSPTEEEARDQGWSVLLVPTLFTLASLALLVWGSVRRLPFETVGLAAACVLCGLGRTALTFREVQALADSRRQARTDELTGLGNRRCLYESVQASLDGLAPGEHVAVMLVDLDRFKEVNDSLGHHVGDELLREVARRLSSAMRPGDVLVRLGGDEFAVALRGAGECQAIAVAGRLTAELEKACVLDGVLVYIAASIGIAIAPDVANTVAGLLQRADIAMYQAKAERRGTLVYEASADDDLARQLRTVNELHDAIRAGELVLHYQPKADLRTGRIVGVEALVRWQHPDRGLLYPDAFIPEAERAGLIRMLTSRVLALATDQAAAWAAEGIDLPIAVNVSASNLLDVELPDEVFGLLAARGLPPASLVVEITESTLMLDRTRSLAVLHRLRAGGIRISVDDYGTGYSSLAYLRDLPVDELKLDRSFVSEMGSDERAAAIVESTVRLAHSLGLPIVAEGIETAGEMEQLRGFGCDYGQGYWLSRPVPASEVVTAYSR
jgi:diguanylate cyclase (GGDEF)-like protein